MDATPAEWGGVITTAGLALLGGWYKLKSIGTAVQVGVDDGKAVKEQVENGHPTNLREDLTEVKRSAQLNSTYLRDVVSEHLGTLTAGFGEVLGEVRGLRTDVSQLRQDVGTERAARTIVGEAVSGLEAKLDRIEQSLPSSGATSA